MDDTATFSNRSNAKRAAEKMIANGTAPAVDYRFKTREDGRFEIVWKTAAAAPTTGEIETEIAAASATADKPAASAAPALSEPAPIPAHPDAGANGGESSLAANDPAESESAATAPPPPPATAAESVAAPSDPFARIWDPAAEALAVHKDWLAEQAAAQAAPENQWPDGTRVMVRKGTKSWSEATIARRLDADYWRVQYPAGGSGVFEGAGIRAYDAERDAKPARQPRRARQASTAPRKASRSSYAIDPAAIAAGTLPDKAPVVTSKANQLYQKKFDALHGFAVAGDWAAVRDYKVTGSNSYSKMVERYRQDLLAVHAAQAASTGAEGPAQ
jgi:hypothetical protein